MLTTSQVSYSKFQKPSFSVSPFTLRSFSISNLKGSTDNENIKDFLNYSPKMVQGIKYPKPFTLNDLPKYSQRLRYKENNFT